MMLHSNEPGLRAHCQRVAALAEELGVRLNPSKAWLSQLREAALSHHTTVSGRKPDLGSQLIDFCNVFDEQMEFLPYDDRATEEVMRDFPGGGDRCYWSSEIVQAFAACRIVSDGDLACASASLPVFPQIATRAISLLGDDNVRLQDLAKLVKADQVLAASVLRVANSALYCPGQPIATVERALLHIGTEATQKLVLALTCRPLFASARLTGLWTHSMIMGDRVSQLAARAGVDSQLAFLAGLLHDLGRLIIEQLPRRVVAAYLRLIEKGCPPCYVEALLCGRDHGEIGARLLEHWSCPLELVEALRFHHRPEISRAALPALVYLAECQFDSAEDLPSRARYFAALTRAGLPAASVQDTLPAAAWVRALSA